MTPQLKKSIRKFLNRSGWEIHRYRASSDPWALVLAIIRRHDIDLVVDVGANAGQYASELRARGYAGRIVSFEPLSQAHAQLERSAAGDAKWTVAPRCAIGARAGQVEINISENSVSSSILPLTESLTQAAPQARYLQAEPTPMMTLDAALGTLLDSDSRLFLKIDTQGFESEVLDGADATLEQARGVCVETSLVPLYDGQRPWRDIIDRLESGGWTLWDVQPAFSEPSTGQLLQADLVFSRPARA